MNVKALNYNFGCKTSEGLLRYQISETVGDTEALQFLGPTD